MNDKKVATRGFRFLLAFAAGVALSLVFAATGAVAANDAYLDALKAEAATDAPPLKDSSPGNGAQPQAERSHHEMEEWLRTDFVGSYKFYQSLPDVKKRMVYRTYESGGTIVEVRQKILELLKQ